MPKRCICDRPQLADRTPSTHRGAAHLSTCPHSTLARDTKRSTGKLPRSKPVPGTRRVVIVHDEDMLAADAALFGGSGKIECVPTNGA